MGLDLDRIAIKIAVKGAVEKRGGSLAAIARAAGLHESSCRGALRYPIPAANHAIADYLGSSVHELWPDWFDEQGIPRPGMRSRMSRPSRSSRKGRLR